MEAQFSLRKQGKGEPVIVLQVFDARFRNDKNEPRRRFMYSTGQHMKASDWKYYDKKNSIAGYPKEKTDTLEIIAHLEKLAQAITQWGKTKIGAPSLLRSELKSHLDNLDQEERKELENKMQQEEELFKDWLHIINTTKNPKTGELITEGTKRSKKQTLNLVTEFCASKGRKLTFKTMDMSFYHDLDQYMKDKGLNPNTRGKHIKEVKAVLREAADRDYEVNQAYQKKSFKVIRKETDATYLNEVELKKLMTLKLTKPKEIVRDIFVMACFVGARHGDWNQIRQSNIVRQGNNDYLKIKQQKTTDSIHVPVHPLVRMILAKYDGNPPRVISNQKFNKAIKEICQSKDLALGKIALNGKLVDKYEHISTHTARRSFATNAYLSKSMEVYSIMNCTGHKTESSFLKYLKLSGLDKAQDIAESRFFKDDQWNTLKVA